MLVQLLAQGPLGRGAATVAVPATTERLRFVLEVPQDRIVTALRRLRVRHHGPQQLSATQCLLAVQRRLAHDEFESPADIRICHEEHPASRPPITPSTSYLLVI